MRANRSGAIVNVASIAGDVSLPIQGADCASKFAVVACTQSLAVEMRAHWLCDGDAQTDDDWWARFASELAAAPQGGRSLPPILDDIVQFVPDGRAQ